MFKYISNSPTATEELARRIAGIVPPGMVFCLDGDLGAGKTLFTRSFSLALGVEGEVTSPTFNLMNIYEGKDMPIFHFDLYRLENEYELEDIGFYEYTSDPEGVILIEWSDKFTECLPEDYIHIDIARAEVVESQRVLTFTCHGDVFRDFYRELEKLCQF